MAEGKLIKSLKWSNTSLDLHEFLDKYGVPHLVSVKEGFYNVDETCSFEIDELLMLHTIRTKHRLIAEDSVGRSIVVPLDCENKLLVCPLPIHCRYDIVFVSQIPLVFPNIRYFRVLENHWIKLALAKPNSILEVKQIDTKGSVVKFQDIDQVVPFNAPVIFEPLLDFREYMLKEAVKYFGIPAKVRFLPTAKEEPSKVLADNSITNLGKVTVFHSAEPQEFVVATKIDHDILNSSKTSVNCFEIAKDYCLEVKVAKGCLKNNSKYIKTIRNLSKAFSDTYDLNKLHHLDKYEYFDSPEGYKKKIIGYVREPRVNEREGVTPESSQRNQCGFKVFPVLPQHKEKQTIRDSRQQRTSVEQYENCVVEPSRAVREFENQDRHVYESVDESDDAYDDVCDESNDAYEDVFDESDHEYDDVCGSSLDYVDMTSQEDPSMDEYMLNPDRMYLPALSNRDRNSKNSSEITRAKSGVEHLLKHPIPSDLTSLSVAGVGSLLTCLNMERYVRKFQEEHVDGKILMNLDKTALQCLGLTPFHVRKLIKLVKGWRPNVGGT